jgi:hypothetical protein
MHTFLKQFTYEKWDNRGKKNVEKRQVGQKEPLWMFPLKFDSPVIKTLERHFFTLSECLSNVYITEESNFGKKNVHEMFN